MSVIKIENEVIVTDIFDFLKKFQLENRFLKDEKLKCLDDWEFPLSDEEIIIEYLEEMKDTYNVVFCDEGNGYFRIQKVGEEGMKKNE